MIRRAASNNEELLVVRQPGISRNEVLGLEDGGLSAIAHSQSADPDQVWVIDPFGLGICL